MCKHAEKNCLASIQKRTHALTKKNKAFNQFYLANIFHLIHDTMIKVEGKFSNREDIFKKFLFGSKKVYEQQFFCIRIEYQNTLKMNLEMNYHKILRIGFSLENI